MTDLIDKSLVSVGPGLKVPFRKFGEFKELQSVEIAIEPPTTVYQDALDISDTERVKTRQPIWTDAYPFQSLRRIGWN